MRVRLSVVDRRTVRIVATDEFVDEPVIRNRYDETLVYTTRFEAKVGSNVSE